MDKAIVGKECPYCKTPITKADTVAICGVCDMPHHLSCWQDNQGCTTFGCTGTIREVIGPNTAPAPVAAEPPEQQEKPVEILYESESLTLMPEVSLALENTALILDRVKDKLFARCTFRSMANKPLKAVLVEIACQDIWGSDLGEPVAFQYLDMKATREAVFGPAEPIELRDKTTRKIKVAVKKVMFADDTVVSGGSEAVAMGAPQLLGKHLGSDDLAEQYARDTSRKARFLPEEAGGYWRCACGCLNTGAEESCYSCGCSLAQLKAALDIDGLNANLQVYNQARQAEEEAMAERIRQAEEQVRLEKEERERQLKKAEKKKKQKKTVVGLIVALLVVALLGCGTVFFGIPYYRYQQACTILESGQYDAAREAFLALGNFLDSPDMATECLYQKAGAMLANKEFDAAIKVYTSLGGYKDSATQIKECKYQKGLENLEKGIYDSAFKLFTELGDYKDSKDLALESKYQQAQQHTDKKNYKLAYNLYKELGNYKDSENKITATLLLWEAKVLGDGSTSGAKLLASAVKLTSDQYEVYYSTIMLFISSHTDGDVWYDWGATEQTKTVRILLEELPASYKDTSRLLKLLKALENTSSWKDLFEKNETLFRQCWDLNIVRYIAESDYMMSYFLRGYWTGSGYYLNFYKDQSGNYSTYSTFNLPWVAEPYGTMFYDIEDGIYYWSDKDMKHLTKVFRFEIVDYDTIRVFCYKNGMTYTMYR